PTSRIAHPSGGERAIPCRVRLPASRPGDPALSDAVRTGTADLSVRDTAEARGTVRQRDPHHGPPGTRRGRAPDPRPHPPKRDLVPWRRRARAGIPAALPGAVPADRREESRAHTRERDRPQARLFLQRRPGSVQGNRTGEPLSRHARRCRAAARAPAPDGENADLKAVPVTSS